MRPAAIHLESGHARLFCGRESFRRTEDRSMVTCVDCLHHIIAELETENAALNSALKELEK